MKIKPNKNCSLSFSLMLCYSMNCALISRCNQTIRMQPTVCAVSNVCEHELRILCTIALYTIYTYVSYMMYVCCACGMMLN